MIILSCPSCGSNEMVQNGSKITCKECGSVFAMIKKAETAPIANTETRDRVPESKYDRVPAKAESTSEDKFDIENILNDPDITGKYDRSSRSENDHPYSRDSYSGRVDHDRRSSDSAAYDMTPETAETYQDYPTGKHESPKSSRPDRNRYYSPEMDKSSGHIKASDFDLDNFGYDPKSRKKAAARSSEPAARRPASYASQEAPSGRTSADRSYRETYKSSDDYSFDEYRINDPDQDIGGKYLKAALICLLIAMAITLVLGFVTDFQFIFLVLVIGLCTGGLGFVGWLLIFHSKKK